MTVYARLMGGLGNQMFEIAAAVGLATRAGCDYAAYTEEPFSLGPNHHPRLYWATRFPSVPCRVKPPGTRVIRERRHGYQDIMIRPGESVVMTGYWQSWRYWWHCCDMIKSVFPVTLREWGKDICAVHCRGSDYLSPSSRKLFYVCKREYYDRAFEVAHAEGFKRFALVGIGVDCPEYRFLYDMVDEVVTPGPADFEAIASCAGVIGPNSTFSWWPAMLGRATWRAFPSRWFVPNTIEEPDIVPDGWLKIEP